MTDALGIELNVIFFKDEFWKLVPLGLLLIDHLDHLGTVLDAVSFVVGFWGLGFGGWLARHHVHLRVGANLVRKDVILGVHNSVFSFWLPSDGLVLLNLLDIRQDGRVCLITRGSTMHFLVSIIFWLGVLYLNLEGINFIDCRLRSVCVKYVASIWMFIRFLNGRPQLITIDIYLRIILSLHLGTSRNSSVPGHNILYLVIRFFVNWLKILLDRFILGIDERFHVPV